MPTVRSCSTVMSELDTGTVMIHPTIEEVHVEIAQLMGFEDRTWMVWRPGEHSFEDLQQPRESV